MPHLTTTVASVAMLAIAALLELIRAWFARQHYPDHLYFRRALMAMQTATVAILRVLSAAIVGFFIAAMIGRTINEIMPEDGFGFGTPSMLALLALGFAIAWFSLRRWVAR